MFLSTYKIYLVVTCIVHNCIADRMHFQSVGYTGWTTCWHMHILTSRARMDCDLFFISAVGGRRRVSRALGMMDENSSQFHSNK